MNCARGGHPKNGRLVKGGPALSQAALSTVKRAGRGRPLSLGTTGTWHAALTTAPTTILYMLPVSSTEQQQFASALWGARTDKVQTRKARSLRSMSCAAKRSVCNSPGIRGMPSCSGGRDSRSSSVANATLPTWASSETVRLPGPPDKKSLNDAKGTAPPSAGHF